MRSLYLLVLATLAATHAPPTMMNTALAAAEESVPSAQEASVEPDRVAAARASRSAADLRARFARAGVSYPPAAIFLRAFKHERELELWALPAATDSDALRPGFRWVHTYPLQAASGALGPKRREGDGQVPEGVYQIDRFNPRSRFHLSLGLNYPNASDLARTTNPTAPGSDIFLHGGAQSDGCLAVGDPAIEELYLVALDTVGPGGKGAIPVHLFPCRMTPANWREVLAAPAAQRPELGAFWRELQPIFDAFERESIPPAVSVGTAGVYRLD